MQEKVKKLQQFFQHHGCWLLLGVILLLGLFCNVAAAGNNRTVIALPQAQSSTLTALPGSETDDEAAFRWDYRFQCRMPLRIDSRTPNRLHGAPVNEPNFCIEPDRRINDCIWQCKLRYDEIKYNYYRRLWHRVLPTRAGPAES